MLKSVTNDEAVTRVATETVRRVQAGAKLTTALARQVVTELGSDARPTAVMFEATAVARRAVLRSTG